MNELIFMQSTLYPYPILTKLEFTSQIFEKKKNSNIKFHENSPIGPEVLHADRQTNRRIDGHDEGNSRFSQFCERA